jgi:hypothetical protein
VFVGFDEGGSFDLQGVLMKRIVFVGLFSVFPQFVGRASRDRGTGFPKRMIPQIPRRKTIRCPMGWMCGSYEDQPVASVAVDIWYPRPAPWNDEKGKTGFAHRFEAHDVSGKSKHTPEDSFFTFRLEAAGWKQRPTVSTRTRSYELDNETVPSNQLEAGRSGLEVPTVWDILLDDLTEALFP